MKLNKILAACLAAALLLALASCAPAASNTPSNTPGGEPSASQSSAGPASSQLPEAKGGTLMLLTGQSSGAQYDFFSAYMKYICDQLGYKLSIVYGDPSNDASGNLDAVKNGMTSDVVGIVAMQDGGLVNIMDEYPDLYVAGYGTDMASVYDEGGASADVLNRDHFLGTMADCRVSGADIAADMFDLIVSKGYTRIATVMFPPFAFPQYAMADGVLREMIAEYNASADAEKQIEVVGEAEVLMFAPIADSYFMESSHQDLDCIVALCDGVSFVYPGLKNAIASGTAGADTKLITGGFNNDPDVLGDTGGDGVIQAFYIISHESMIYPLALLDNAIQGAQYSDYPGAERVDSARYIIDSREDMDNVLTLSGVCDADMSKLQLPWEDAQSFFVRFNPDASYAQLSELLQSDRLTVDELGK